MVWRIPVILRLRFVPALLLGAALVLQVFPCSATVTFVPQVEQLDLGGRSMPDVEWEHPGSRAAWQAGSQLWVAPMDLQTGYFAFASSLLLASNLAPAFPFTEPNTTGNGPEWGNASTGSAILYSVQDGLAGVENWRIGRASVVNSLWQAGFANAPGDKLAGSAPEPTKLLNDPNPLVAYYYQSPGATYRQIYWHSLVNTQEGGVMPFINSSSGRWAVNSHLLVSTMTVNNYDQVVLFDAAVPGSYSQLTFDTTYSKSSPWLWRAPEFGNELVLMALERTNSRPGAVDPVGQQLGLYRVINGVWTRFETIQPPITGDFTYLKSAEVFVYGGLSYVFMPQLSSNALDGTNIWVAGIGPNKFYRQVAGPSDGISSTDPEYYESEGGVYLYLCQMGGKQIHRAWTGVGPRSQNLPAGMSSIPAATFTMGDTLGDGASDELPVHSVTTSAFFMDRYDVSSQLWQTVANWANLHGYTFELHPQKAADYPVTVDWYEAVRWCNARSEFEGRTPAYYTAADKKTVYRQGTLDLKETWVNWLAGYRLPTESEWENAARAGVPGHRYPWVESDTISHEAADYYSTVAYPYDVSATRGYHPAFSSLSLPYTCPVTSFPANSYGLHGMSGNLWQWCWDWYNAASYTQIATPDSHGWPKGKTRIIRGGSWASNAFDCRVARRGNPTRQTQSNVIGFRTVLPE